MFFNRHDFAISFGFFLKLIANAMRFFIDFRKLAMNNDNTLLCRGKFFTS